MKIFPKEVMQSPIKASFNILITRTKIIGKNTATSINQAAALKYNSKQKGYKME